MSTVIIGAIFMDVKGFSNEHYVPTGTNIGRVYMMHGGVCRNVCEDFANQGVGASFVSMTDRSAMGRDIRERLSALGVDLRHMLYADGGMGIWLAVLDEHGELVGSISQQPDFTALENHLRDHGTEIISAADCVVLEIDMNERIARTVLTIAERLDKPVYAIVGNMGVILAHPEFLRQVRCFICNEIEAGRLFSADLTAVSPEEMLALLPGRAQAAGVRSMAVTLGSAGAVFFDGETGDSGHCPALPAEMVDSTGAGDAFFAGAVMALSRGFSLRRAVQVGTRLAARTIACGESSCPKVEGLFDFPKE